MSLAGAPGRMTLLAGADIGPVVEPVDQFAELILPTLGQADVRFAQCERTYSKRGFPPGYAPLGGQGGGDHSRLPPRMASIWKTAGIDVASVASNHARDWGPDALVDTVELLRGMGIATVGAGRDEDEARRPAIIERNGVRVAFLAYCSAVRPGDQAGPGRAGVAPLRARAFHEVLDPQPGTPAHVRTEAVEEDVRALEEDVRRAREQADAVVVSLHWGVRVLPKTIADYQPPVAQRAIEAGADLILGHHPHMPKAVGVYRGKVCFYSMGNLMSTGSNTSRLPYAWNLYWYRIDPDCQPPKGMYHFSVDAQRTLLVRAEFTKSGVERVSFLPGWIDCQARPAVLSRADPRFDDVVAYMEWVSDQFPHTFRVEGDEVVVGPG